MKCEICGKPVSVLGKFEAELCDAHCEDVVHYIKSLKPKVHVNRWRNGYAVSEGIHTAQGGSCQSEGLVTDVAADALYEYMRRERNDWRCPACGAYSLIVSAAIRGFECTSCGTTYPSQ